MSFPNCQCVNYVTLNRNCVIFTKRTYSPCNNAHYKKYIPNRRALHEHKRAVVFPDTIFMDINMPLMNGTERLCALINISRISHIPFIMLSTAVDKAEPWYKFEAKGYIKKPGDVTLLPAGLTRAINKEFIGCNA